MGLVLLDLSHNTMKAVTKDVSQSKMRVEIIQNNIHVNILLDLVSIIQVHGLYPKPGSTAPCCFPVFD